MTAIKRFGFINAKLRTRLGQLLEDEFMTRLIRATNLVEAMLQLKDSSYAPLEKIYSETGDLKMAELELYAREIGLYREVQKYLDPVLAEFINSLLLRYETDCLKGAVRLWFDSMIRKRDVSVSAGYLYRDKIIHRLDPDEIIGAADTDALVRAVAGTPYAAIIARWKDHILNEGNLFALEMDLDAFFYDSLYEAAGKLDKRDRDIVNRIIGVEIDLENISRTIRLRMFCKLPADDIVKFTVNGGNRINRALIRKAAEASADNDVLTAFIESAYPGFSGFLGDSSDPHRKLALLESLLNDVLKQEVRRLLLGYPFTIGIILAYFFFKKKEISSLMTILNAKNYAIPEDQLRGRI
ncbi:MAG: V-type ATPase subunit [Spirochaetales bacterium]|nr:V-type ATPase subunit [Spirochaetales bacterium]